jgi:cbb3-type cytochrome oxidase maturation protein
MSVFYVLVPVALLLAGAGVLAFRWAVRDGQFDDVETPALRMLLDDEPAPPESTPEPRDAPPPSDPR